MFNSPDFSDSSSPLPALGILQGLTADERTELSSYGSFIDHQKGGKLVEQGQPQGFLHLVLEGELSVVTIAEGILYPVGYVHAGECVGEMTLLEPVESASASVVARSTVKVWAIQRREFEEFLKLHSAAGSRILREIAVLLARRLRRRTEEFAQAQH